MDSRNPPALLPYQTITPENFTEHLSEIESALKIPPCSLYEKLFDPAVPGRFNEQLELAHKELMRAVKKSIDEATYPNNTTRDISTYLDTVRVTLLAKQKSLNEYLQQRETELQKSRNDTLTRAKEKITGCPHIQAAVTLNTFKQNIIIALQDAAFYAYAHSDHFKKSPQNFNAILEGIACIDTTGELFFYPASNFSDWTLQHFQERLNQLETACREKHEPLLPDYFRPHLVTLNFRTGDLNDETYIDTFSDVIRFTHEAVELESLASLAAQRVTDALSAVDASEKAGINELADDNRTHEKLLQLLDYILQIEQDFPVYEDLHCQHTRLIIALEQEHEQLTRLQADIDDLVTNEILDTTERTEDLIDPAEISDNDADTIIECLDDIYQEKHAKILEDSHLDFVQMHYSLASSLITAQQIALDALIQKTLHCAPPLQIPALQLQQIEMQRLQIHDSIIDCQKKIEKICEELREFYQRFDTARTEFINFFAKLQPATTAKNLDNLITEYSNNPAFEPLRDSELENLLIEFFKESKHPGHTKKSHDENTAPPQKPNIFIRHPWLKYVAIGALILAGAALLSAMGFGVYVVISFIALKPLAYIGLAITSLCFLNIIPYGVVELSKKILSFGAKPKTKHHEPVAENKKHTTAHVTGSLKKWLPATAPKPEIKPVISASDSAESAPAPQHPPETKAPIAEQTRVPGLSRN